MQENVNNKALKFIAKQVAKNPRLVALYGDSIEQHLFELEEELDSFRICSHCEKPMIEGYCIEDGEEYYCSDECLHKHFSKNEYLKMYNNGNGNSYWTNWWEYAD